MREFTKAKLKEYLQTHPASELIEMFSRKGCRSVIFSGATLNSVLGFPSRDLDIVVDNVKSIYEIENVAWECCTSIKINSFGGIKLTINDSVVDIWPLCETYTFKKYDIIPTFERLIDTSILNLQAIVYFPDTDTLVTGDETTNDFFYGVRNKFIELNNRDFFSIQKAQENISRVLKKLPGWKIGPKLRSLLNYWNRDFGSL